MSDDMKVAALMELTERGVPADIREILVHGNPSRGIAPGALSAVIRVIENYKSKAGIELTFTDATPGTGHEYPQIDIRNNSDKCRF